MVYQPKKFHIDNRNWTLAARARSGQISREEAIELYKIPISETAELEDYVKKRLALTDKEYEAVFNGPSRSFREFKSYKSRFERLRFLFKIMADRNLVPRSFYLKYCFPLSKDQS
jgi:hypothetical protein